MKQTAITFNDDVLVALNMTLGEVVSSMKQEYAKKMFQSGKLTLGQAAEFCEIDLYDFTALLAMASIPVIDYETEELEHELATIGVVC